MTSEHFRPEEDIPKVKEYPHRKRGDKCDPLIYKHGNVEGMFAMSKEDAEKMCDELEAQNPGFLYDWSFSAGRVVLRSLNMTNLRKKYEELKTIFEPTE